MNERAGGWAGGLPGWLRGEGRRRRDMQCCGGAGRRAASDVQAVVCVCEGGVIAGKAVCEDLCCSGSSFATARGPVRNPHNEAFAAGGSSSGCGALVRHGQRPGREASDGGIEEVDVWWQVAGQAVDLAIGADQVGSAPPPHRCLLMGLHS